MSKPFGPRRHPLLRESARKAFHLLSLIYLAGYKLIGWPAVLRWMAAWAVIIFTVETARLALPKLNAALTAFFGGLAREDEHDKYSGIIHTTLGVLIVFVAFGAAPRIVAGAIYCVAFGDAAAALVGKAFGRTVIRTGKSLEGSAACFSTCALSLWALGFSAVPVVVASLAATLVELCPTTRWFNDNLWMPVVAGAALKLCAGS